MSLRKDYIDYLKPIRDYYFPIQLARINKHLESGSFEHFGCDIGLHCVDMNLLFFEEEHNQKDLDDAVLFFNLITKLFYHYLDNNKMPNKPIFNRMFGISSYCQTFMKLRSFNIFSQEEETQIYEMLVYCTKWMVDYPEWGAHNRASIRGRGMINAAKAFPNKMMSEHWMTLGKALIADSLGKWSIEDAATYNPIWIIDIIESFEEEDYHCFPNLEVNIRYYLNFLANLQAPEFIPLEYGDARLGTQWGHVIHALEYGASKFNNPEYKYVADRIFKKMKSLDIPENYILNQSRALTRAARIAKDMEMKEIYGGSLEVLDDLITKKIIFKNGLYENENTSCLFLNYKDELENGYLGRRNLDETICAPAEKVHHGHSDENAINYLSYDGTVLLHDGGYREKIDLTGAFRADFYHNKVVVRNNLKEDTLKTLELEPYYNKVKTLKLYFYESKYFDSSRTRVIDNLHHVFYDRAITFLKKENIYVVVDIIKSDIEQNLFLSNQYFSQVIEKIDEQKFLTHFNQIGSDELKDSLAINNDSKLLIDFAYSPLGSKIENFDMRRSYQNETLISNNVITSFKKDETKCFVTILSPMHMENLKLSIPIKIETEENGVKIDILDYAFTYKFDIEKGFVLSRRPMYSYELCKMEFSDLKTDAIYAGMKNDDKTTFAFVFGSKLIYKEKCLFTIEDKVEFYQADISEEYHIGSYPYFEGIK